jgi:teichuronic acid biosynthesis glycosyltransferase TuaC
MKILHVTNAYPTSKLPVYGIFIKEQVDSLKSLGINSDLYFINGRENGKTEYIKAYRNLKKIINNYDIIHAHHFLTALVVLACKPSAKVVVTFLSDGIKEFIKPDNVLFNKLIKQNLFNYILKHSDARIFKKSIPLSLKVDKFSFYLPNGVNTDMFYPISREEAKQKLGLKTEKNYILFVSLIDIKRQEKRYDIFQKTMNILQNKYGRNDVEELCISNIARDSVNLYINASRLHMLTSDFEGSPNSVKECLASNIPVISTNVGNVPDLLKGLKNSFISQTNNPEELADLVNKSLNIDTFEDSRTIIIKNKLDINSKAIELKNIYDMLLNK